MSLPDPLMNAVAEYIQAGNRLSEIAEELKSLGLVDSTIAPAVRISVIPGQEALIDFISEKAMEDSA